MVKSLKCFLLALLGLLLCGISASRERSLCREIMSGACNWYGLNLFVCSCGRSCRVHSSASGRWKGDTKIASIISKMEFANGARNFSLLAKLHFNVLSLFSVCRRLSVYFYCRPNSLSHFIPRFFACRCVSDSAEVCEFN